MHGLKEPCFSVDPGRTPCSFVPAVLQEAGLSLHSHLDPRMGGISCQDKEAGLKFLY